MNQRESNRLIACLANRFVRGLELNHDDSALEALFYYLDDEVCMANEIAYLALGYDAYETEFSERLRRMMEEQIEVPVAYPPPPSAGGVYCDDLSKCLEIRNTECCFSLHAFDNHACAALHGVAWCLICKRPANCTCPDVSDHAFPGFEETYVSHGVAWRRTYANACLPQFMPARFWEMLVACDWFHHHSVWEVQDLDEEVEQQYGQIESVQYFIYLFDQIEDGNLRVLDDNAHVWPEGGDDDSSDEGGDDDDGGDGHIPIFPDEDWDDGYDSWDSPPPSPPPGIVQYARDDPNNGVSFLSSDEEDEMELIPTSFVKEVMRPRYYAAWQVGCSTSWLDKISGALWLRLNGMECVKEEFFDAALGVTQLAMNPTVANFFLSLLRQLNRIFRMDVLTQKLFEFVKAAFAQLEMRRGNLNRPEVMDEVELIPTSIPGIPEVLFDTANGFVEWILKMGESTEMIASVLASIVVTIATVVMGMKSLNVRDAKPLLLSLGTLGVAVAGVDKGIAALKAMTTQMTSWLELGISYLVGCKTQNKLMYLVSNWDIEDSGEFEKSKLFSHIDFLLDPRNMDLIRCDMAKRELLTRVAGMVDAILQKHMLTPLGLTGLQVRMLQKYANDLRVVMMTVFRCSDLPVTRFTPFWINLYGAPGTGKSTMMTKMANDLMDVLWKVGGFGVSPRESGNRCFPINFTDKYMVGYTGQYTVTIDDIFQDSGNANTEGNSAYLMIGMVSGVPYRTVQAGLTEKGLPFDSKIIWSTSNVKNPIRKEIVCQDALLDRISENFEVRFKQKVCDNCRKRNPIYCSACTQLIDPDLGKPTEIVKMVLNKDSLTYEHAQTFENAHSWMQYLMARYSAWWIQQHYVMKRSTTTDEMFVDRIVGAQEQVLVPTSLTTYLQDRSEKRWREAVDNLPMQTHNVGGTDVTIFAPVQEIPVIMNHTIDTNALNVLYMMERRVAFGIPSDIRDWFAMPRTASTWAMMQQEFQVAVNNSWQSISTSKVGKALLFVFGAAATYFVAKGLSKGEAAQPTAIRYQDNRPGRVRANRVILNSVMPTAAMEEPFVPRQQNENSIVEMVELRGCVGTVKHDGKQAVCVRIKGPYVMMNHHFADALREGDVLEFHFTTMHNKQIIKQIYDPLRRCVRIADKDVVVYKCDSSMCAAKDITGHFPDDATSTIRSVATIVSPGIRREGLFARMEVMKSAYTTPEGEKYDKCEAWRVDIPSVVGSSGSLLILDDPRLRTKIAGIQTCASRTGQLCTYFCPITKSELERAMNYFSVDLPSLEATALLVGATECPIPEFAGSKSLMCLGEVPKENRIVQPRNTKIVPSCVHDPDNKEYQPAILSPYDRRLPSDLFGKNLFYRGMEKFDQMKGVLDSAVLLLAFAIIKIKYCVEHTCAGIPRRLLNDFEMVNGIFSYLSPFDMRTSPGFPWIKKRTQNKIGKFEWFEEQVAPDGEKTYYMGDQIRKAVQEREQEAKQGRRVVSVSYACLKDETRTLEKINAGKTRVFMCMPMDFNLLVRKYFGAFVATMHALAGKMPSCVGIDANTGWTALYRRLRSVGSKFEDFDYGGWDVYLHPDFFEYFARVCNAWYGDVDDSENGKVRLVLMHEVVHNFIIVDGYLVLKSTGNTSGCAITAELNSFIGDMLMLYCWLQVAPEEYDMDFYDQNVAIAVYGDDVVKATSEEASFFNGNAIKPIVDELGMTMTDGLKGSGPFVFKNIEDVTFLKRKFRKDGEEWRAPLINNILFNIPQWVQKSDDIYEATEMNCETALREAAMNGCEFYEEFQSNLNARILEFNQKHGSVMVKPRCNPYSYYMREIGRGYQLPVV